MIEISVYVNLINNNYDKNIEFKISEVVLGTIYFVKKIIRIIIKLCMVYFLKK